MSSKNENRNNNKSDNNNRNTCNRNTAAKATGETSPASIKKMTSKQIVAIIGIVLLVLMYVVTLIVSIFDRSASGRLFWMCLFSTMAIPLLIWIYTWMYGKLTRKHTFADFDLGGTEEQGDGPLSASEAGKKEDR